MATDKKGKDSKKEVSTVAVKRAYDYIKEMSINFSIKPSSQINEIEIAELLDMSRVPVREALNRLVMSGFAIFDPGKGFFCRRFSETEMKNLYGVRSDLEVGALRELCRMDDIASLLEVLNFWKKISDSNDNLDLHDIILLDENFHIAIISMCSNTERLNFIKNIYERIRFVRKIHIEKKERCHTLVQEHIKILQAIVDRDETLATKLVEEHLGVNSTELKDNIKTGMLRIYKEDMV